MVELEPHILAILGVATAATGIGLVAWGASAIGSSKSGGRSESFLAPTLTIDTLDDDLRVLYMRTMVLDARCQARYGAALRDEWSLLGRELRRTIVTLQADRHGGRDPGPPDRFEGLETTLDAAIDHVVHSRPLDQRWHDWIVQIRGS